MLKNYKRVRIEEIVNRQLALAKFDENSIKSFSSKEQMDFLNKFYDYCRVNRDSYSVKWSEWRKNTDSDKSAAFSVIYMSDVTSVYIEN